VEDAEDAAKKARAAAKRREARHLGVLAGLDELDAWLGDVIAAGTGSFPAQAVARARAAAARMVDARAGGLATELDGLPAALFAQPDGERDAWLVGALGRLALLSAAYRRLDVLPEPLRADVRALVGWTTERADLLEDPGALRVVDRWTVLGTSSRLTPDERLLRHETWLGRHGPGSPAFALLLDFTPVAAGSAALFRPGESFAAELVYYPSAWPLRALVGRREAEPEAPDLEARAPDELTAALREPAPGIAEAACRVASARASHPWLDPVPVCIAGVRVARHRERFVLVDDPARDTREDTREDTRGDPGADRRMLPLLEPDDACWALAASGSVTTAGLWGDGRLRLLAAQSPWGSWFAA
jgi:hypothetical protein